MPPSDQIRLLLVEDVPQVAQYMRGLLQSQSQIRLLDVVAEGSKVLALVPEVRPDVVIVDALLQGRPRGMQLVKQLHESGLGVPVIVLTVPQQPIDVDPSAGIHGVLAMPFSGYDLVTRVVQARKEAEANSAQGPSRIVAVFAPKGGVGRTTIAFNMAVAAAQAGARTVVVDGSLQFADLRSLLRVPPDAPSIHDLPTDRIAESDLAEVLWRDPSGIDILLAPPRIEYADMISVRDVDKILSLLRRLYDLVVIDMSVGLDDLNLLLLDQADVVLEIVTYDSTTIHNTIAMADTFRAIGYPATKVRYLVNRADATGGIDPGDLAIALGRVPEHAVRSEGEVVVAANNQGVPFVLAYPDAGVSRDIVRMTTEILAAMRSAAAVAAR
jgi:pilus assembly protein CpaE